MNDNVIIFLSWSGIQSQKYAEVLSEFIRELFGIDQSRIFLSSYTFRNQYAGDWFSVIEQAAKNAKITIPCLIKDNIKSPWIHYELGLSKGRVLPVLFDTDPRIFKEESLDMLSRFQTIFENGNTGIEHYKAILSDLGKQLISIFKKQNGSQYGEFLIKYRVDGNVYDCYAKKLIDIANQYSDRKWFVSRPFKDDNLHSLLEGLFNDKNDVFLSESGDNQLSIPESRCEQIGHSKGFILVYPKDKTRKQTPPSSCLIELGMALAFGLNIFIMVEEGARVPKFIDFFTKSKAHSVEYYKNNDGLRKLLNDKTGY